ncbi:MAG: hypothetical protein EOP06_21160 [Proteobacteria bacterium]|nr:MAG: hypothetical protein EOP06_21160 [Pseudomonadota bacterium]
MSNESDQLDQSFQPLQSGSYDQAYFDNETPEQKQARTEHWRGLLRQGILSDLSYHHKQRWIRLHAELFHKISDAPDEETKAKLEAEMDELYKTRFYPETSREALLAEIDTRELPPPGL